jgi:two-component system response regulator MprA
MTGDLHGSGPRILVADPDPSVRGALARALALQGFGAGFAADARTALARMRSDPPDLVVLDRALPGGDGLHVLTMLRQRGERVPVVMVAAGPDEGHRVRALETGADDYLDKPFVLEEMVARMRALLRRSGVRDREDRLRFGDLLLDRPGREARRGERPIALTPTEYRLLEMLLENPRRVVSHGEIYRRVWGGDPGPQSNALSVCVAHLRRKLELGGEGRLVHTARGVGYVLRETA